MRAIAKNEAIAIVTLRNLGWRVEWPDKADKPVHNPCTRRRPKWLFAIRGNHSNSLRGSDSQRTVGEAPPRVRSAEPAMQCVPRRTLVVIHVFFRPQRACPAGEPDWMAKWGNRTSIDPHVLVTWVKEIRWLVGQPG